MIHKSMSHWLTSAFFAAVLLGCAGPHKSEIAELNGVRDSLSAAQTQLATLPVDSLATTRSWAVDALRDFEVMLKDSGMTLTREEGLIVAEVTRAKRLLKDFPDRITRMDESINRAHHQIEGLIALLDSRAATDGAGNPIDTTYIRENVTRELRVARDICGSVEETKLYARRGLEVKAGAVASVDSLQTVLRARLATLVLNRTAD
jgi:hypothetical protein